VTESGKILFYRFDPASSPLISAQGHEHRWARLLSQLPFPDCRFPFPFAGNKLMFAVSLFRLQQANRRCLYPLALFSVCSSMFMEVDFWNTAKV
jgi:hypothetical protein